MFKNCYFIIDQQKKVDIKDFLPLQEFKNIKGNLEDLSKNLKSELKKVD